LKCQCFAPLRAEECFDDEVWWHMAVDEEVFDKKLIRNRIMGEEEE